MHAFPNVKIANPNLIGGYSGPFTIPPHDYVALTYIGATNNIATQVFKSGGSSGTAVATLTYAYAASGVANDDLMVSITRT